MRHKSQECQTFLWQHEAAGVHVQSERCNPVWPLNTNHSLNCFNFSKTLIFFYSISLSSRSLLSIHFFDSLVHFKNNICTIFPPLKSTHFTSNYIFILFTNLCYHLIYLLFYSLCHSPKTIYIRLASVCGLYQMKIITYPHTHNNWSTNAQNSVLGWI